MRSFIGWIALVASLLFNLTGGDAQSLTVSPTDILSGGKLCPNTFISFTCNAYSVRVLNWLRNGGQIKQFTALDMPSTEPQLSDPFRVFLNSSSSDDQNNLNMTSTLVGMASDFQTGDQITCPDATGETLVLSFTTNTPIPVGFQVSVGKGNTDETPYLNISWDSAFNVMYGIESYQLETSDGFISCLQMCPPSDPCQCSGLEAGRDGNVTITATACGDMQGPPAVIYVTPRVPAQVSSCSSYPVYNASNRLYRIETTWNQPMNRAELTSGVRQDILDYSVSVNGEVILTNCSNTSSNCSYFYNVQPLSTVNVSARNIFGLGEESPCNLPPSSNENISPINDVFTITLSTTNLNRTVDCKRLTQIPGVFSCQLCIEINDSFTCYILENSSNSAANTALTDLREGTYFYRVTVFLDDVPVASTYDFFSTSCQTDELVMSGGQMNSQCLGIPNGMVCYNGTTAGSVATYTCDNEYMLMGTAKRTCRIDGRWEGSIPSCELTVPSWVIPLLAVSVIIWVLCLIEGVISIPISIILECRVSENKNRHLMAVSIGMLIVEIILFILVFSLWIVYANDPTGLHGRNSVIAAFVFSLVLVVLGCFDVIPVFLHLKSLINHLNSSESQEESPGVYNARRESLDMTETTIDDPEQRHKGVDQRS